MTNNETATKVAEGNTSSKNRFKTIGYLLPHPENCTEHAYKLMLKCWLPEPEQRPNFEQILSEIDSWFVKEITKENQYAVVTVDEGVYNN